MANGMLDRPLKVKMLKAWRGYAAGDEWMCKSQKELDSCLAENASNKDEPVFDVEGHPVAKAKRGAKGVKSGDSPKGPASAAMTTENTGLT